MILGLVTACVVLSIAVLILLYARSKEKKQYAVNIERYSKIVDIEKEAEKLRNELDSEEKQRRKTLELEEKAAKKSIHDEVEEKRISIDREVKNKLTEIEIKEKESEQQLSKQKNDLLLLKEEYREKRARLIELTEKLSQVTDDANMVEFGIYKPRFDYHDSIAFQEAIKRNKERQKSLIRQDAACDSDTNWEVNGSKAEGGRMIKRYVKLLTRAFNSECDAAIAKVKSGNVDQLHKRIETAFDALNKFGHSMNIRITHDYLNLRLEELVLCHEKELKLQNERDILREERELQREEEKAQREYDKAIKEELKAERDFEKAMERARKELDKANQEQKEQIEARISELESQLEEARALSERAKSQAQLTRSGHVYVISNIGAFGEDIYKIGLTRRLEPEDRVNELGSASVPFKYDIHALIYSDDAPTLETSLHQQFSKRRINLVNNRKEFFRVPLSDIESKVRELGYDASFDEFARAPEYRESQAIIAARANEKVKPATVTSRIEEEFPEMI
ncbi:T5orf172 domain [Yersinia frederiksenii]|nr:T5orf172 domain [Yersinia frederiksenii]